MEESEKAEQESLEELEELETLEELESPEELEAAEETEAAPALAQGNHSAGPLSRARNSRRLPLLLRLTRRATVFLSLTLIATIIFFVTGNKQTFLDSNLRMILKIIAANAIALSFFSLSAIPECIFFAVTDKKFRLVFHLVCYALIFIASVAVSVLSLSIHLLSEGIDF